MKWKENIYVQKASIERKNNTKHTFAYQKLKIELQRSKSIYYSWVEEKFNYIDIQYICFEVKKAMCQITVLEVLVAGSALSKLSAVSNCAYCSGKKSSAVDYAL